MSQGASEDPAQTAENRQSRNKFRNDLVEDDTGHKSENCIWKHWGTPSVRGRKPLANGRQRLAVTSFCVTMHNS